MALEDDIAILSRAPLFNLMDHEALRLIAFAGEHRILRAGDVLFRRGDKSDGGFVVTKGLLMIAGKKGAQPFVAEPGALIGQTALFSRGVRPATATASEPSAVLRVSPTLMRRVLQEFPSAAEAMHGALATELVTLSDGLERVRAGLTAVDEERASPARRGRAPAASE
jgi:CRP-like cAMP-binding protein